MIRLSKKQLKKLAAQGRLRDNLEIWVDKHNHKMELLRTITNVVGLLFSLLIFMKVFNIIQWWNTLCGVHWQYQSWQGAQPPMYTHPRNCQKILFIGNMTEPDHSMPTTINWIHQTVLCKKAMVSSSLKRCISLLHLQRSEAQMHILERLHHWDLDLQDNISHGSILNHPNKNIWWLFLFVLHLQLQLCNPGMCMCRMFS